MIRKILSFAFVALLIVACKDNNTEATTTENLTPETETLVQDLPEQTQEIDSLTTETQTIEIQTPATPANAGPFTQQPQQSQTTGQTAPGWSGKPNPPHGQPGHRCDITVGAILP